MLGARENNHPITVSNYDRISPKRGSAALNAKLGDAAEVVAECIRVEDVGSDCDGAVRDLDGDRANRSNVIVVGEANRDSGPRGNDVGWNVRRPDEEVCRSRVSECADGRVF